MHIYKHLTRSSQSCEILDLVRFPSFLNTGQADDGFAVLQGLMEDAVGIALDLVSLSCWRFVVFLHLFSLYGLQRLNRHKTSKQRLCRQSYEQFCNICERCLLRSQGCAFLKYTEKQEYCDIKITFIVKCNY